MAAVVASMAAVEEASTVVAVVDSTAVADTGNSAETDQNEAAAGFLLQPLLPFKGART
jgi:hypothetical protein